MLGFNSNPDTLFGPIRWEAWEELMPSQEGNILVLAYMSFF
jgi:hypothetical protein